MEESMTKFHQDVPMENVTPCPNVENVKFTEIKERLINAVNNFNGAPFTIQRLCELVTNPKQHYKRPDKFVRGIEKNINVVSSVDPSGNKIVNESKISLVNGLDNGHPDDSTSNNNGVHSQQLAPFNSPGWFNTATTATWGPETSSPIDPMKGKEQDDNDDRHDHSSDSSTSSMESESSEDSEDSNKDSDTVLQSNNTDSKAPSNATVTKDSDAGGDAQTTAKPSNSENGSEARLTEKPNDNGTGGGVGLTEKPNEVKTGGGERLAEKPDDIELEAEARLTDTIPSGPETSDQHEADTKETDVDKHKESGEEKEINSTEAGDNKNIAPGEPDPVSVQADSTDNLDSSTEETSEDSKANTTQPFVPSTTTSIDSSSVTPSQTDQSETPSQTTHQSEPVSQTEVDSSVDQLDSVLLDENSTGFDPVDPGKIDNVNITSAASTFAPELVTSSDETEKIEKAEIDQSNTGENNEITCSESNLEPSSAKIPRISNTEETETVSDSTVPTPDTSTNTPLIEPVSDSAGVGNTLPTEPHGDPKEVSPLPTEQSMTTEPDCNMETTSSPLGETDKQPPTIMDQSESAAAETEQNLEPMDVDE
ncbi:unnamed protein product [Owenia fusiformis]|nr:unnamed protein product [Owenia fusiformis]